MALEERQILESLREGAPLPAAQAKDILSPSFAAAIIAPTSAVVRARGLGLIRLREFYWLTGRPGSGKTQALTQFVAQLPRLEGAGKYAFAALQIDQEGEAAISGGLAYSIVRHALAGEAVPEIGAVATKILRGSDVDSTVRESVGFGVDVIAGAAGLPPASLFASVGVRKLISWVRATGPYVRAKLRERWAGQPEALELLVEWVRYVLRPNSTNRARFEQVLLRLSGQADLFGLFCRLLESAGYSTLVIVLDEVNPSSLRGVKALWDRPVADKGSHTYSLNLVVVLAAQDDVRTYAERDEVLCRRLCATDDGHFHLPGAIVQNMDSDDDFAHVARVVREILTEAPYLQRRDGEQHLGRLRQVLSSSSPVTWQRLWKEVIDQLARLSAA